MIYSEAFDSMPPEAKRRTYKRLHAILTGEVGSKLTPRDRQAILEILADTKTDWNAPPVTIGP